MLFYFLFFFCPTHFLEMKCRFNVIKSSLLCIFYPVIKKTFFVIYYFAVDDANEVIISLPLQVRPKLSFALFLRLILSY